MNAPHRNKQPSTWYQIKVIVAHPILSFVGTFIGLIAAIRSEDSWIRWPAIVMTLVCSFAFLFLVRFWLQRKLTWLTRKYFIGLAFGVAVGAFASPFIFQPALTSLLTLVAPHVIFVDSFHARSLSA